MQSFIRFVGVLNAAVWLGAAVFFTILVGPAFFSAEMLGFLPRPHAGRAAEVILERYFSLQQWCAGVALLHLLAEYFYSGRVIERVTLVLLAGLLAAGLIGGYGLLPKMHELQRIKYSALAAPPQKAAAASAFAVLHGVSQAMNLVAMLGLLWYFWRITRPVNSPKFPNWDKFKG